MTSRQTALYVQNAKQIVRCEGGTYQCNAKDTGVIVLEDTTITLSDQFQDGQSLEVNAVTGVATIEAPDGDNIVGGTVAISPGEKAVFTRCFGAADGPRWTWSTEAGGSAEWRAVTDWYIDADDGDDLAEGTSEDTPLQTWAELMRRLRGGELLPPALDPAYCPTMTVHLLTDLPDSDPVRYDLDLGHNVAFRIKGENTQTLGSGTYSAITAQDRATNQRLLGTTVGADWAGYAWNGASTAVIRNLDNGAMCFVVGASGDVGTLTQEVVPFTEAELLEFFFSSPSADNLPALPSAPTDQWEAKSLTKIYVDDSSFRGPAGSQVVYQDLEILQNDLPAMIVQGSTLTFANFYGCIVRMPYCATVETIVNYSFFRRAISGAGQTMYSYASLFTGQIRMQSMAFFPTLETMFQGSEGGNFAGLSIYNGALKIGSASIWGITGAGPNDPTGAALYATPGADVTIGDVNVDTGEGFALWGSGNVGGGIAVGPGATVRVHDDADLTVTGTAGDFLLAGATSSRAWDETANAGEGGWSTALISNTWAHFDAVLGVAGLGGAAMNVGKNALLVRGL